MTESLTNLISIENNIRNTIQGVNSTFFSFFFFYKINNGIHLFIYSTVTMVTKIVPTYLALGEYSTRRYVE